jgi:hypothetical protein
LGALACIATTPQAPAEGRQGKLIASPRFEVPEHMLAPPRPAGSATVTFSFTGRLALRGCFTSAWTNGRKVKCPAAARRACLEGRKIEIYVSHAQVPRQTVTAAANGRFAATVTFEDDYIEGHLKVGSKRVRNQGLKIACHPLSESFDISEERP